MSAVFKKRVIFKAFSLEKGYFLVVQVSVFLIKGVLFSSGNISERGNFLIWRTIIRPPFYMRVAGPGVSPTPLLYGSLPETPIQNVWATDRALKTSLPQEYRACPIQYYTPTYPLLTAFPKLRHCHFRPENHNKFEICSRKFEVGLNLNMAPATILAREQSVFSLT